MKKLIKKIIALMAAFQLFMNVPVIGFLNVSAAETFAYQDALIPIEAFATAIAIGSGIVASKNAEAIKAASGVISRAIASVKARACGDASTAFRVIKNNKSEKPGDGDDKNNHKWFVRGAAAVATGKLVVDLTASGQMMEAINNENGYTDTSFKTGIVSKNVLINESTADKIYNDLSIIPGGQAAWRNFINKFESNGNKSDDYFYNVYVSYFESGYYPAFIVNCYSKDADFEYMLVHNHPDDYDYSHYKIDNNSFNCWTFSGNSIGTFYNSDDEVTSLQYLAVSISQWQQGDNPSDYSLSTTRSSTFGNQSAYKRPVFGYVPASKMFYELTNNTYKAGESTETNFPDWVQSSIETINGNLEAINLAINNLQLPETWNDTQTNIQTGTAPANVINQYINNWSNPEQAPDPGPDPGPNPDPDPEPEPEPGPGDQPAAESAVEKSGKDLFDWAMKKITLPNGFFDKLPFSIPYDIYLLLKSMFPSGKSARSVYSVRSSDVSDTNPNSITVSSNYEASGISTRTHTNKWVRTAPIINIDLHWKYHGVDGKEKSIDIVKTVDLSSISYFAMIIYISIYIFWFFLMLSWIMSSFKG